MPKLVKRYKRRKRSNPSEGGRPKANPPLFTDLLEFVLPGFGGFAVTRFTTRVAATQVAKRWPKLGKHAGAVTSVGGFMGAWFLAHKVKALAKYHTPIVVGSAIAMLQSLIQLYVPKLGWMVADASPELEQIATGTVAAGTQQQRIAQPQMDDIDDGFEVLDDAGWRSYNDAGNAGRYARTVPKTVSHHPPEPEDNVDNDDAVWAGLEDDDDLQAAGNFG